MSAASLHYDDIVKYLVEKNACIVDLNVPIVDPDELATEKLYYNEWMDCEDQSSPK